MRLVAWNIRAGGGRRVQGIAAQLEAWGADVVALTEFRGTPPSRDLATRLAHAGLAHQRSTVDPATPSQNAIAVASRWPLRRGRLRGPVDTQRWLPVSLATPLGPIALGALHVPNFASGRARKLEFLGALLEGARRWRGGPALYAGDTNTGRITLDEESPVFDARHDAWMVAMAEAGWPDAFRVRFPDRREFTWYSPNAGNGFRLDEAFANRRLLPRVRAVRHAWGRAAGDPRRDAVSDHAALVVDFE